MQNVPRKCIVYWKVKATGDVVGCKITDYTDKLNNIIQQLDTMFPDLEHTWFECI